MRAIRPSFGVDADVGKLGVGAMNPVATKSRGVVYASPKDTRCALVGEASEAGDVNAERGKAVGGATDDFAGERDIGIAQFAEELEGDVELVGRDGL